MQICLIIESPTEKQNGLFDVLLVLAFVALKRKRTIILVNIAKQFNVGTIF